MATDQTCLDIGDLIDVLDLLKKCSFQRTKWQELGLRLGLLKDTLEAIEMKHRGDVLICLIECLSQWLRRADNVDSRGGANLDSLSDALGSMNETAVAEKLKHQVLINIFNNRHTVLSQSLCDSVSIAWSLYGERMLTQEAVSRVVSASPSIPNQREALLTAVKEAVQTDPNSLHTFANVLCTISTNVSLGQTILDDISKYFPTPEVGVVPETIKDHDVVPQDNTSTDEPKAPANSAQSVTSSPSDGAVASNSSSQPLSLQAEVQVPVSEGLMGDFTSMRMSYGSMFYHVGKIIKRKSPPPLEEIKEFLSCCSTFLGRKAEQCSNLSSILRLIQNECSLTNIAPLCSIVEEMEITEAEEHIEKYRTELKEFCKSLSISLCLEERFSSIPHLQCQTLTLLFDWEPEEHLLKDIMEFLAKVSDHLKETEEKRQKEKKQKTEEKSYEIDLYCNHPVTGELVRSTLKVHKDELLPSVLDKAYELMELAPHIPIEKCRLVKYDYVNKVIDQSFDLDEFQHQTIRQLVLGGGGEARKENETFKKYVSMGRGINLKVSVVDLSTGEVGAAKPVRGEEGWTVAKLKQHIGEILNIDSSHMRLLVMEKEYMYGGATSIHELRDGHSSKLDGVKKLYVSSDPEDYQKEFKDSLMYSYVDIHINSILLDITIPPGPETIPTITNVTERGIIMKIVLVNEENDKKKR
uniref:Death domain-containing protein n=1 Tax=Amphimedon queenslandica TaxID=400682 RepID=A0A1X7TCC3_AMPQE